jgi:hypothetical protein
MPAGSVRTTIHHYIPLYILMRRSEEATHDAYGYACLVLSASLHVRVIGIIASFLGPRFISRIQHVMVVLV